MDMPKLGPAQQQLAKLAGNWSGEEKLSPSQWDPKGGTAMGRVFIWLNSISRAARGPSHSTGS